MNNDTQEVLDQEYNFEAPESQLDNQQVDQEEAAKSTDNQQVAQEEDAKKLDNNEKPKEFVYDPNRTSTHQLLAFISNQYPDYSEEKYKKIENLSNDATEESLIKTGCSAEVAKELFANRDKIKLMHNQYQTLHDLAHRKTNKKEDHKTTNDDFEKFKEELKSNNKNTDEKNIEQVCEGFKKENHKIFDGKRYSKEEEKNRIKLEDKDLNSLENISKGLTLLDKYGLNSKEILEAPYVTEILEMLPEIESSLKNEINDLENFNGNTDKAIANNAEFASSSLKMLLSMLIPFLGLILESLNKTDNVLTKGLGDLSAKWTKEDREKGAENKQKRINELNNKKEALRKNMENAIFNQCVKNAKGTVTKEDEVEFRKIANKMSSDVINGFLSNKKINDLINHSFNPNNNTVEQNNNVKKTEENNNVKKAEENNKLNPENFKTKSRQSQFLQNSQKYTDREDENKQNKNTEKFITA